MHGNVELVLEMKMLLKSATVTIGDLTRQHGATLLKVWIIEKKKICLKWKGYKYRRVQILKEVP